MKKLAVDKVSEIRAANGVYAAADVARHYGVHRSTVIRLWAEERRAGIRPASEAPNIETRPRPGELKEDIRILLNRGMTPQEVADTLNISVSSVYAWGGVFL